MYWRKVPRIKIIRDRLRDVGVNATQNTIDPEKRKA